MLNANPDQFCGIDPDQTSRSAASDQGLHCLPMSLLWDVGINGLNLVTAMLLLWMCTLMTD